MTLYYVVAFATLAAFSAGFYRGVLLWENKFLRFYQEVQADQIPLVKVSYDLFAILGAVSDRAGIVPPKLLFMKEYLGLAGIFRVKNEPVIVCDALCPKAYSEKEYEGIIAHEVGHLFTDRLYRATFFISYGFEVCSLYALANSLLLFITSFLLSNPALSVVAQAYLIPAALSTLFFTACEVALVFLRLRQEFWADKKALSFTRYPWSFVEFLEKEASKGKETPPLNTFTAMFFGVGTHNPHPSLKERAKIARKILEKYGVKS